MSQLEDIRGEIRVTMFSHSVLLRKEAMTTVKSFKMTYISYFAIETTLRWVEQRNSIVIVI